MNSPTSPIMPDEPGFAPNAFSAPAPPQSSYDHVPHWYDRILDVMLGEDETLAKNRLALVCSNCRLVNGQAPPGVKTVEEVGKWRCASCGSWNGKESENAKALQEMTEKTHHIDEETDDASQVEHENERPQRRRQPPSNAGELEMSTRRTDSPTGSDSGLNKRVTRSASKKPSFDALE